MQRPTTTVPARTLTRTRMPHAQDEYDKFKQSAIFIGWMGELISMLVLILSALALHCRDSLAGVIVDELDSQSSEFVDQKTVLDVVVMLSSGFYALSLINILVCSMLLIGIARRSCSLIFPWLLFYGLLFCVGVHIAIYLIVSGFCDQIEYLVMVVSASMCASFLFSKIYYKVLDLYRKLQSDAEDDKRRTEQMEVTGVRETATHQVDTSYSSVPYQSFI